MLVIHATGENALSVFVTSLNALLKLFQNLPILAESSDLHSVIARGNFVKLDDNCLRLR